MVFEKMTQFGFIYPRHIKSFARDVLDQFFAFQPTKSLADRRSAGKQHIGDFYRIQTCALRPEFIHNTLL
ncbi:hypothetical protein FG95_03110 [Sphingopyxis sp. LC363]|nr:hypothetical protein FG95_03110 [Sphingopyxis sp. LC363]